MSTTFTVIKETSDYLVISKPAGMSFHDEGGNGFFKSIRENLGGHLYPVHRLDKITSGLILVAKGKNAAVLLSRQFQTGQIEKYYLAISDKKPRKKQGLIIGDMTPSRRGSWKLETSRNNPAITQFFSQSLGGGLRLYLLRPRTGKTHQLRVAMKSIGAPVAGDPLYNKITASSFDRGYLHAYSINFQWNREMMRFISRPDEGILFQSTAFSDALAQYSAPWDMTWPQGGGRVR